MEEDTKKTSKQTTSKEFLKSILKKPAEDEQIFSDEEINASIDMLAASALPKSTERTERSAEGENKPSKRKKRTKEEKEAALNESTKEQKNKSRKMALSYLKCWKKQQEQWKFQKVRQTWLLKHMYDESLVTNIDIKNLYYN